MVYDVRDLIEGFLIETGMAATRFGRNAAGDPRLVLDLRNGRTFRPETRTRVRDYITDYLAAPA